MNLKKNQFKDKFMNISSTYNKMQWVINRISILFVLYRCELFWINFLIFWLRFWIIEHLTHNKEINTDLNNTTD